jgi:glycosyltransferase involved in cell wall biosynthesis
MVGDGPLRSVCEEFVRANGVPIRFSGFLNQSKIWEAYLASDALVLPSDGGETWGVVVNEAMACGRPCIVSDHVGCGPDLIRPGTTGETYPLGDVEMLTAIMKDFATDPVRLAGMGEWAKLMAEKYSVQAAVDGVLQSLAVTLGAAEPVCAH